MPLSLIGISRLICAAEGFTSTTFPVVPQDVGSAARLKVNDAGPSSAVGLAGSTALS